jgi:hypothetical protein
MDDDDDIQAVDSDELDEFAVCADYTDTLEDEDQSEHVHMIET